MNIRILATESLGVRGLCCLVETADRSILFDPGMALGYRRQGLLPHPAQVAVGERIREEIIGALRKATDVVISHFHGDHMPLVRPNPYQLPALSVRKALRSVRLWTKGFDNESQRLRERVESLAEFVGARLPAAQSRKSGCLTFSTPVPHGRPNSRQGNVIMTRVQDAGDVFVHASDVQMLNEQAVRQILSWKPGTVLVSGPPLYLSISARQRQRAWRLTVRLSRHVETLIIDHHLLRCPEGLSWIRDLSAQSANRVACAADFEGRPRRLLEARRARLYTQRPVPRHWHERYRAGLADAAAFAGEPA